MEGKGEGSLPLFTINLYLGWRLDGSQSLWASVGYGWGDLTIDDDDDDAATSTDLTQWSVAAGATGVFYQSGQSSSAVELNPVVTSQLLWKADAWFSSLQVVGKTWGMGRGCVIMKGATLELHEQRLSTWLQGF